MQHAQCKAQDFSGRSSCSYYWTHTAGCHCAEFSQILFAIFRISPAVAHCAHLLRLGLHTYTCLCLYICIYIYHIYTFVHKRVYFFWFRDFFVPLLQFHQRMHIFMARCFSALPYNLSMCSTPPPCAHSPTRVVVRECALNARWFVGSQLIFFFYLLQFFMHCLLFLLCYFYFTRRRAFCAQFLYFPQFGWPATNTLTQCALRQYVCMCVYACD